MQGQPPAGGAPATAEQSEAEKKARAAAGAGLAMGKAGVDKGFQM